ncbi:hypothetical protein FGO68_gene1415 [Halteria grandinella]|uniref:Uncharacterized protein n=1 Tax=Halteria grandinella TaxID=5974 RepID=A0A8J8NYZ7_HALGN|nr:hypothetical protein FGO68_gene1415 [Halteria grandinella]
MYMSLNNLRGLSFGHLPASLNQCLIPTCKRPYICVPHFLSSITCESRAEASSTVHDELLVLIGELRLYVSLKHSFAKMHRSLYSACVPFAFLSHIQQSCTFIAVEPLFRIWNSDLLDSLLGIICDGQEGRRMAEVSHIHEVELVSCSLRLCFVQELDACCSLWQKPL